MLIAVAFALLLAVSAMKAMADDNSSDLIKNMQKDQISQDSQEALQETFGDLLTTLGPAKFNNIATKENIAIINVTIDGRDRRILTRLKSGFLSPIMSNISNFELVRTRSLIVLGNISLKGILYSDVDTTFGARRLYGPESTNLRYTDEGFSRLVNGKANISINPILKGLIESYNVYLSPYGLTRGIYVAEKTGSYFIVKSVNPSSNIAFSWMLSGIRSGFGSEYLNTHEIQIKITAEIYFENQTSHIMISGLQTAMQNATNQSIIANASGLGISLTGNVILSTDLSSILQPVDNTSAIQQNSTIQQNTSDANLQPNVNNSIDLNLSNASSVNATAATAPISNSSVIDFTLYSVDESYIINQTAYASGLSPEQVKRSISFVYKQPENFTDEVLQDTVQNAQIDGIKKVNGSVIVTIG